MEYFLKDKYDFTWCMLSWTEGSKPAICLRVHYHKYVLNLLYFRHRPKAYLKTYPKGLTDKRVILEGLSFYKDASLVKAG